MASDEKPLVYLILGAAGSGRRTVVADLIDGGLGEGDRPAVLLSADEAPAEIDAKLADARQELAAIRTMQSGGISSQAQFSDAVTAFSTTPAAYTFHRKLTDLWALRARGGYAFGDNQGRQS